MGSHRHDVVHGSDESVRSLLPCVQDLFGRHLGHGRAVPSMRDLLALPNETRLDDQHSSSAATIVSWLPHFIRSLQNHPRLAGVLRLG